jgi:DNA-binding LytR/AlgR family response regulator
MRVDEILDKDSVLFIEAINHGLRIVRLNDEKKIRLPLSKLSDALEKSPDFVKINRSYIINMNFIYEIDGSDVYILEHSDAFRLPIGRRFHKHFKKALEAFDFAHS